MYILCHHIRIYIHNLYNGAIRIFSKECPSKLKIPLLRNLFLNARCPAVFGMD